MKLFQKSSDHQDFELALAVLSVDKKKAECIEMETKLYQVQNQIFNLKCGKYKTSKDNSFP